ncbi:dihydrolipoamide acetyltransferase family protein [Leifsonia sp. C5G2]|uniref:dihydrolipoamide acetyltransferase family protein n=1 Tax=Leifsonia sp. C5G2 TaxID=2735269 RepID=UPI001584C5E4|nr:dihydrolipoamide acetyltransferase family protein [Leifsonia sp. C5G2]NUU07248.1 2-oxo acid dehydrogenase subunit E2 [Leifsonia sp. C5G2]
MGDFTMPALGADMEEGTLVEWMIKPGDVVHKGQLVAAVDTDKSVIDVETFDDGVVTELLAKEGDRLPVGALLARIVPTPATRTESQPTAAPHRRVSPPVRQFAQRAGIDLSAVRGTGVSGAVTHADVERAIREEPSASARSAPPAASSAASSPPPEPAVASRNPRSSPRARRLAADHGIDLSTIAGTGPGGAITEADLRRVLEGKTAGKGAASPRVHQPAAREPGDAAGKRAAGLRRTVGALMTRSKKTIPHYYLTSTVDLRAAMAWLESANSSRSVGSRIVPAVLLLRATSIAAHEMPEMNGYFEDGHFSPSSHVNVGVVVSLRTGGIIAPAILDADTLPVDELMGRFRDVVDRARAGRLQRAEMTEATITVTNLGDLGVDSVLGVIYPPQVALVGFGRVSEQPWAHDGMVGTRPAVNATLSADHRVSDGMRGARFLSRIAELLQGPDAL